MKNILFFLAILPPLAKGLPGLDVDNSTFFGIKQDLISMRLLTGKNFSSRREIVAPMDMSSVPVVSEKSLDGLSDGARESVVSSSGSATSDLNGELFLSGVASENDVAQRQANADRHIAKQCDGPENSTCGGQGARAVRNIGSDEPSVSPIVKPPENRKSVQQQQSTTQPVPAHNGSRDASADSSNGVNSSQPTSRNSSQGQTPGEGARTILNPTSPVIIKLTEGQRQSSPRNRDASAGSSNGVSPSKDQTPDVQSKQPALALDISGDASADSSNGVSPSKGRLLSTSRSGSQGRTPSKAELQARQALEKQLEASRGTVQLTQMALNKSYMAIADEVSVIAHLGITALDDYSRNAYFSKTTLPHLFTAMSRLKNTIESTGDALKTRELAAQKLKNLKETALAAGLSLIKPHVNTEGKLRKEALAGISKMVKTLSELVRVSRNEDTIKMKELGHSLLRELKLNVGAAIVRAFIDTKTSK